MVGGDLTFTKIQDGEYYMDGDYSGHWQGTLYDLLALVAQNGGDMLTRITIESDGEPLYLSIPMQEGT